MRICGDGATPLHLLRDAFSEGVGRVALPEPKRTPPIQRSYRSLSEAGGSVAGLSLPSREFLFLANIACCHALLSPQTVGSYSFYRLFHHRKCVVRLTCSLATAEKLSHGRTVHSFRIARPDDIDVP